MDIVPLADRDAEEVIEGVQLTELAVGDRMNVQYYEVEPGAELPTHSHPEEQVGYLHDGELVLLTADGERVVQAGDSYVIEANEKHGAVNRTQESARGVDIFNPPRSR